MTSSYTYLLSLREGVSTELLLKEPAEPGEVFTFPSGLIIMVHSVFIDDDGRRQINVSSNMQIFNDLFTGAALN